MLSRCCEVRRQSETCHGKLAILAPSSFFVEEQRSRNLRHIPLTSDPRIVLDDRSLIDVTGWRLMSRPCDVHPAAQNATLYDSQPFCRSRASQTLATMWSTSMTIRAIVRALKMLRLRPCEVSLNNS
jgi:hypothetical protein